MVLVLELRDQSPKHSKYSLRSGNPIIKVKVPMNLIVTDSKESLKYPLGCERWLSLALTTEWEGNQFNDTPNK